ncbi:TPA: AAA family ATPase [Candidatus Kaiserbacteria bacterium]|nr:MAG: AAA ATPase [Parcubacteria group bacterium GW2011_GWA1_56_13]KKW46769.1 MAG: AAA ATPase [Parcubacteria group bacterium GW2011_GWB1_57_6]HCR52029.1 AAA family ATPase [Candidatus Kaiserbacteria bacterium]
MTQGEALAILKTGANVYLTGEPGSGKTHTINEFVGWLRASGIEPSVTAATGIAATHVGGMTLHSWSGIGIAEALTRADVDRIASKEHIARRIHKAKVLIIEEISMLSAATFEMADAVCREVRRVERPFGGLTVILVGDFFQLPPVSRGRQATFAYASSTWHDLNLLTCYLTEQYRQDDGEFLATLSAIRSGEVEEVHYERLMSRRIPPSEIPGVREVPKLFSHNADVDRINAGELAKLPGKAKKFRMTSKGKDSLVEGLMRGCLSPEVLELKEGAAVMFTKNSPQGRFVNGTLGAVAGWDAAAMPVIETKDGLRITAEPMEWQVEEQGKVKASISQLPLRLAYAMTVHKSQGMSMDAAVMDLSRAFEYGQGYVALSRVRRLSGVYLTGLNERALEVHPDIVEKDRDFRAASEAAREAFAPRPDSAQTGMSEAEKLAMQKQFVKAMGGAWCHTDRMGVAPWSENVKNRKQKTSGLPGRLAETLQAARDGTSLREVAKTRALAVSTIVKHLEELAEIGKLTRTDFAHLVPLRIIDEIHEALATAGSERLSPAFHALGGRHSFETIRLVRLMKNQE